MSRVGYPSRQGLYDPQYERDACGVGFVANIQGRQSHALVQKGIEILQNLEHRGACGCEKNTGDGAGLLLQTPHKFLAAQAEDAGVKLPAYGKYAAGILFLPTHAAERARCQWIVEQVV